MMRLATAAVIVIGVCGPVVAQRPAPPEVLPTTILDPASGRPAGPLSPAEAARQRDAIIRDLKEDLRKFDPDAVAPRQVEGRWQVWSRSEMLKDFGSDRGAAYETARVLQQMRVTQVGTVPGARPEFLYWLSDGKAPRGTNSQITVMPVSTRSLRAEQIGGAWAVTDGTKALYDFGDDADAAKRAAIVFWKYGFNQLGIVGAPRPAMVYPLADPRQAALDKVTPVPTPSPLRVLQDVSQTSLLLPGNVYAGPKTPLDAAKLEAVQRGGEWVLAHGDDVFGRFGSNEIAARGAMKALREARPTEFARLGEGGFPLFLANGQPIHAEPLGALKTSIHADRLRVQHVGEVWWVFEENRPILKTGAKGDAELIAQVIRLYDLKILCVFGQKETGLQLLTAGR